MVNFLWIGLNCLKAVEPTEGNSLLLAANPQDILILH